MENFVVAILFFAISTVNGVEISQELYKNCFPHNKMCDVDVTSCFDKDGELVNSEAELVTSCNVYQNDVFKSSKPRNFSIDIAPWDLSKYPTNITYSVFRHKKSNDNTIWSKPLEPIEGCCDMTLSKSCFLPKYDPQIAIRAIFPLSKRPNNEGPWYGIWEVPEYDEFIPFCEEIPLGPCLNFTGGRFYLHDDFIPLSSAADDPITMDYCFFLASQEIYSVVLQNNRTTLFKRSVHFSTMDMKKDCVNVPGEKEDVYKLVARKTDITLEGVICFHYRIPESRDVWQNEVLCFPAKRGHNDDDIPKDHNMYFHAVAGSIAFVTLLLMILMGYWLRRHVTKKIEKSLPSTLVVAKATLFTEEGPRKNSFSNEDAFPIEVYFPMEGLPDDHGLEEDPIELDSVEKYQIWSSDNKSASMAEEGNYCKKFDMHSYVKVKREIDTA